MTARVPRFPVGFDKKPLTPHGFKDASTDPVTLAEWNIQFPQANVAMPTGAVSGFDVLDLDVKDGRDGRATLTALEAVHGQITDAPMVKTPSGGFHIYFRHREGMRNAADRLPGIDIRGDGGYVLIPPSMIRGVPYEWVHGLDPETLPPPEWPAWLVSALEKKAPATTNRAPVAMPASAGTRYGDAALRGIHDELAAVGAGGRDDRRNAVAFRAGRLVASGNIRRDDAIEALVAACATNGLIDDLGEAEVRKRMERAIDDGIAAGPKGPNPADSTRSSTPTSSSTPTEADKPAWDAPTPFDRREVPDFPTETLSPWMGKWVEAEAEATQTPAALAGCVALGVASLALARANVRIDAGGWSEPTNLYLAVAMDSGNRKSSVFRAAQQPILDAEKAIIERFGPQVARINATHSAVAAKLKAVEGKYAREASDVSIEDVHAASDELQNTPMATVPRLITGDVTSERLGAMLAENAGAIGVMSPEGGIFETIAGRYANGVGNLDPWLHGHTGDAIRVDRGSRPPVIVDNPRVTIALTFQTEVLASLSKKDGFAGRGLLARFAFACPESKMGRRSLTPSPMPVDTSFEYHRNITALIDLIRPSFDGEDAKPILIRLDPDAQSKFLALRAEIEPQLAQFGALSSMSAWASKFPALVLRLAAILHVGDAPTTFLPAVAGQTLDRAIDLGRFFLAHARAAFDVMVENPVVEDAKILLTWLRSKSTGPTVTLRDLHQGVKGRASLAAVENLTAPINTLIDMGYVRRVTQPKPPGPGRPPSPVIEIHPDLR